MLDLYRYYPPGQGPAVDPRRVGPFSKAMKRFAAALGGPQSDLEPRKGAGGADAVSTLHALRREAGQERDVKSRRYIAPPRALRELADQDDIIYSIRRTLRAAIGEMGARAVPDLDPIKDEIAQWSSCVAIKIAMPGMPIDFSPKVMSSKVYAAAMGPLRDLLVGLLDEQGIKPTELDANHEYRQFFENLVAAHEATARQHAAEVQRFFDHPNPSAESSWRSFANLLIDDITLLDAGVIVKNPTKEGKLGEIYCLPGEQIEIYRNKDLSTPQPPYIAYQRVEEGQIKAFYNNSELVYIMANPQMSGYGRSPLEVLVWQMVGARYADAWMIDWYTNGNVPFFVFDLGPGVQPEERDAVEKRWDQRVSQGKHRGIFLANKDGVKGFMPMQVQSGREQEALAQLKFWANRKCAAYGLSLNDIGFTEDLHRTTAETQADLTQTRGVESTATVLAGYINGEIVKGKMWVRDDPDNPNSLEGKEVPCFPFSDVKFEFYTDETTERLQKAQSMAPLVSGGILTVNEAREELNKKPVLGGDELVNFAAGGIKVRDLADLPGPQNESLPGAEPLGDGSPSGEVATQGPSQSQGAFGKTAAPLALTSGERSLNSLIERISKLATK